MIVKLSIHTDQCGFCPDQDTALPLYDKAALPFLIQKNSAASSGRTRCGQPRLDNTQLFAHLGESGDGFVEVFDLVASR